jgi:hypothetical protein
VHYTGGDWEAKHVEMSKEFYKLFEELREELGDLPAECLRIMRSYLRYWKEEDAHIRVVDAEVDEIVTLPNGLEMRIIVDLIVEEVRTGLLWPWDHKTRKNFERGDNMLIDPQLTNYYKGLQLLGFDNLGGVMYNEIRTKAPTVPQVLKTGGLSKAKSIDTDVRTYYKAIRDAGFDPTDYRDILRHIARNEPERFFKRTRLPKDPPMLRAMYREAQWSAADMKKAEATGRFVRTFNKQCAWDCDFKSLCIAQLQGGDLKSMIRHGFRNRHEQDEVQEKK